MMLNGGGDWNTLRQHWRLFLGIHLGASLLVAAVLGPLLALVVRLLITSLGESAFTDQDILYAFLSPLGFVFFILGIALSVGVAVFESSAMILAAWRVKEGFDVSPWRLGRHLLTRLPAISLLAGHMTLRLLLLAAPFLIASGWLVLKNLTEFDINYYLSARPPEFVRTALLVAGVLLVLGLLLFRVLTGWVLALPLLLLGKVPARYALQESTLLVSGNRRAVVRFLLRWGLLALGLLAFAAGFLKLGNMAILMLAGDSLGALAWMAGALFLAWSALNFVVTLVISVLFVLGVLDLYEQLGPGARVDLARLDVATSESGSFRLLPLALLLVAGLACWSLYSQFSGMGQVATPQVIAHRGASYDAPENTLASIREAIKQGADWAEIDVQETAEGQVLVIHDKDLMKVAGVALNVYDTPLDTLRSVDIGSAHDPRFSAERVPLLSEVLELAKDRIKLNIELKYYGQEQQLEARVAELVETHGMEDQIVLMSLKLSGVRTMKSIRPDWTVGLLSTVALGDLSRMDVDFFAVNASYASRPFVKRVHERGGKVLTWTVNDPAGVATMASRGVDGIITDRPDMALSVLEQQVELDAHERVLLALASLLGSDFSEQ